jgi:hypothetical protein
MTNLINCGTCGYPLTPEERKSLIERDGVMVKPASMTKDEALKLALEALEHIDYEDNDRDFLFPYQCTMLDNAITAIKQARSAPYVASQLVQSAERGEPVGYVAENGVVDWNVCAPPILTDLYTTPPGGRQSEDCLTAAQHKQLILAEREKAKHNEEVLMNALWKACGDDAQVVEATIDSQGELK